MKSSVIVLAILLLIPIILSFWTPLYNIVNPTLGGMPFFYWFQTLVMLLSCIPYLGFSYIQKRRHPEED